MKSQIKGRVFWVGLTDWDDHLPGEGPVLHFHKSASYNSYLILGDYSLLIDTVAKNFTDTFVENLSREISIQDLYGIILSCGKSDHVGAAPRIIEINPNINVYVSEAEAKRVRRLLGPQAHIIPVHSGDHLDEPDFSIEFFEAEPFKGRKSLFSYIKEERVLFSGYATEYLLKDLLDKPYGGNWVSQTANASLGKLLRSRFAEKMGSGVNPDIVCTNHGTPMYMF